MKKFYALILALCPLFFVACDQLDDTQNPEKSVLTRTSAPVMEFEAQGGNGTITYTLENPTEGVQVKAFCDAEWIDGLTSGSEVTFIVEENTLKDSRHTTIVVSYGEDCDFEVTVYQKGSNDSGNSGNSGNSDNSGNSGGNDECKNVTLSYFIGTYYGTMFSTTHNYSIAISDSPADEEGYLPEDSEIYILDVYSNVEGIGSTPVLPNGTYDFDINGSCAANTIANNEYTVYYASSGGEYTFVDAIMEVSDNKLELLVELSNGETHFVTYEGALNCDNIDSGDDGGNEGGDEYYTYSNLTEDYNFNISGSNAYGWAANYGDWYEIGSNNLYVELYENGSTSNGAYILLDLLTDATTTSIVGTYTPYYESEGSEYLFVEGYLAEDEEGAYLAGSWIATLDNGEISDGPLAPLYLGSVTIAATDEADVYTVTLDCEDDAGYAISGTYNGVIEMYEANAAPQKVQKYANISAKRNIKKHHFLARR